MLRRQSTARLACSSCTIIARRETQQQGPTAQCRLTLTRRSLQAPKKAIIRCI